MSWEVAAQDEQGGLCHIAEFKTREEADEHFKWCLEHYCSATPPYEVEND